MLGALKLDGPLLVGPRPHHAVRTGRALQRLGPELEPRHRRRHPRRARRHVAMCALAQVKPAFLRRLALPLWIARRRAAGGRRHHRPHRQGRAALARSRLHPLPALRDHEARGAHDLRLVAARAAAAAGRARRWCVLAVIILIPTGLTDPAARPRHRRPDPHRRHAWW